MLEDVVARRISAGHYALHLRPINVVWEKNPDEAGTYLMVTLAQETDMTAVCDELDMETIPRKGFTANISYAHTNHAIQAAHVAQTPSGRWCSAAVFPIESHLYTVAEQDRLTDVLAALRAKVALQEKDAIRIPF
jgi:hypothetical protein